MHARTRFHRHHRTVRNVLTTGALLAGALLASACTPAPRTDPSKLRIDDELQAKTDQAFVRQPFEDQVAQGVIRQRTIFEHEFEANSARLSSLGKRDVKILAGALREDGGTITVRQGAAPADLYAARRETVRQALVAEGIAPDRFKLGDAQGAATVSTSEALRIRERIQKTPMGPTPNDILTPTGGANQ
jgi:hypothetical protein